MENLLGLGSVLELLLVSLFLLELFMVSLLLLLGQSLLGLWLGLS